MFLILAEVDLKFVPNPNSDFDIFKLAGKGVFYRGSTPSPSTKAGVHVYIYIYDIAMGALSAPPVTPKATETAIPLT